MQRSAFGLTCRTMAVCTTALISTMAMADGGDARSFDYSTRFSFDVAKGSMPGAPLLQAQDGDLYGTTQSGGMNNVGVLFRMKPNGQVTVLHTFVQDGADGYLPAAGLMQDDNGDIWGTTSGGGTLFSGTVFRWSKQGAYSVVHSFDGGAGFGFSSAPLVQGRDGKLYGTASFGGDFAQGCIFRMSKSGSYSVIHSLSGAEGNIPQYGLVRADDGNFYGTTVRGGDGDCGTVFRISQSGAFARIYSFEAGTTGAAPTLLIQARNGKLYGAAAMGGPSSGGTLFSLSTSGAITVLHAFTPGTAEGDYPTGLIEADDGNFYGTNANFFSDQLGAVFRMKPNGKVKVLHRFAPGSAAFPDDGAQPLAPPTQVKNGALFGTASLGGMSGIAPGYGTIYRIKGGDLD